MTSSSPAIAIFAVAAAAVVIVGKSSSGHWSQPSSNRRSRIYVAGLIPLTSSDDTVDDIERPAPDVLQAVSMALNDVNHNTHILPNYDLHLVWKDTQV